jgi:hypothetical protein
MPNYLVRVPRSITADDLVLKPGDAFQLGDVLWEIVSVTPSGSASVVDLKPWPEEIQPQTIKRFP